jgi:hypothetical protein
MKNVLLIACSFAAILLASIPEEASAQIAVNLDVNHKNFLQFEPVFVRLTFRNMSGKVIIFSESEEKREGRIEFLIERAGVLIGPTRKGETVPVDGLIFRAGGSEAMTYCLSNYYPLLETGSYRIKAILSHPQAGGRWESNYVTFSVGTGVTVWERVVGIPDFGEDGKSVLRKYGIRSFYDGRDKIYYLVVDDDRYVYSVTRLGYDVGTTLPQCEVDEMNRLHVIIQASPVVFSHFIYDWNGIQNKKQVYTKGDGSPTLIRDVATGEIRVAGGMIAMEDVSYKEETGTLFRE